MQVASVLRSRRGSICPLARARIRQGLAASENPALSRSSFGLWPVFAMSTNTGLEMATLVGTSVMEKAALLGRDDELGFASAHTFDASSRGDILHVWSILALCLR